MKEYTEKIKRIMESNGATIEQMNDIDLIDDLCDRLEDVYMDCERNLYEVASGYGSSGITVVPTKRDQFLNYYKADSTVYWFLEDIEE